LARIGIGSGTFLNQRVLVASHELVEIDDHCMLANGCFVSDAAHRFGDPDKPVPWQGFTSKGPTRIGDNVWCGAGVVVTSGVTIGERCVIGANSVVTQDLPPRVIAAGVVVFLLAGLLSIDSLWAGFLPAGFYLLIHFIEGATVTPMLLARRFTITPVLVIISLVCRYRMWGVPGAILSTPRLSASSTLDGSPASPAWHVSLKPAARAASNAGR